MLRTAEGREGKEGGAGGAKDEELDVGGDQSTQSTQYDQIGTKYLEIKTLPAVEPELPSILHALGDGVKEAKCLGMFNLRSPYEPIVIFLRLSMTRNVQTLCYLWHSTFILPLDYPHPYRRDLNKLVIILGHRHLLTSTIL
jgi:hypothetical protein